jgi:hypothetical protein
MKVVIPCNRSIRCNYLGPLIDAGADFIIVFDGHERPDIKHKQCRVFNWDDQAKVLGDCISAIPRGNGACRDFGLYMAFREADNEEAIVCLDDDCEVTETQFAESVEQIFFERVLPVVGGEGPQYNILDQYDHVAEPTFPRGFPYSARLTYHAWQDAGSIRAAPLFNLGLWQGVFDVNAVDKVALKTWTYPAATLRCPNVVIPSGVLLSVCSMNMQMRRSVIPAVYQFPMNVRVGPQCVIDRYGDIWGGFVLKTLMDAASDALTVGGPMIHHLKEGNHLRNIWQENLAHTVNDEFLRLLAEFRESLCVGTYLDMMAQILEAFLRRQESCSPVLQLYISSLCPMMEAWIRALSPWQRPSDTKVQVSRQLSASVG